MKSFPKSSTHIDTAEREREKLKLITSKNNYKLVSMRWKMSIEKFENITNNFYLNLTKFNLTKLNKNSKMLF